MDIIKNIFSTINALCLIIGILFISVMLPTYSMDFYKHEYKKNNIKEILKTTDDELINVTTHLLRYIGGKEENLTVFATIAGERREFFNQKEKEHMVDVKILFDLGNIIGKLALIGFGITGIAVFLINRQPIKTLAFANMLASSIFLGVLAVLAFLISLNFQYAFEIFHKLLFTNDLWQLEPSTDLLINLVPLPFFIDIAILVCTIFVIALLGVIITSAVLLKKSNH